MRPIRVRRVAVFVFLTFALSWGFDFLITVGGGHEAYSAPEMTPWGMLVPAFVALTLQLFAFRDSAIHVRRYRDGPRWIVLGFLVLVPIYAFVILLAVNLPRAGTACRGLGAALITLWTLLVFFVRGRSNANAFERAGLPLGDFRQGQRFVLGVIAFLVLQAILNLAAGLGDLRDGAARVYGLPTPGALYPIALTVLFIPVTVIGIPLSGLAAVF